MIVLSRWRPSIPESPLPRESIGIAVFAGLRYVAMSPNIGKVLLRAFVSGGGSVAILALLPRDRAREQQVRDVHARTGLQPSLDFALVMLRRSLGLPRGSAFALFAIARTVGWIAHVLEQRRSPAVLRPRARYSPTR
jgi:hypothetical protein